MIVRMALIQMVRAIERRYIVGKPAEFAQDICIPPTLPDAD